MPKFMVIKSHRIVQCHRCGHTASEAGFEHTVGRLSCPRCGSLAVEDLQNLSHVETCDTCVYRRTCQLRGDCVNMCKAYATA